MDTPITEMGIAGVAVGAAMVCAYTQSYKTLEVQSPQSTVWEK